MFQIKRNILRFLSKENYTLPKRMCVSYFIENVGIASAHVSHNYVGLCNLVEYSGKNTLIKKLLINTFAVSASIFAGWLDAEFVGIVETGIEWHQHEDEGLWLSNGDSGRGRVWF